MEGIVRLWRRIPLFWRVAGPGLLFALGWAALGQARLDGRLHLHFLSVGPGNAVLIETPSGRWVLLDGGPDPTALLGGLGRRLPFWERTFDWVLLSETDSSRLVGPAVALERYRAAAAGRPGRAQPGEAYDHWLSQLARQGVTPQPLWQDALLDLGDGVSLEVLSPPPELAPGIIAGSGDDALVLRLRYGAFTALLPSAAGPAAQALLLQSEASLASTLLVVPCQAGPEALELAFLQAVAPQVVVVSAGTGYQQGPDARTLLLLQQAGVPLYRTDQGGGIEVITDGQRVQVRTEESAAPGSRTSRASGSFSRETGLHRHAARAALGGPPEGTRP